MYKATRGPLEGNWALACYIAVWPLAAAWYEAHRRQPIWNRLAHASFVIPIGAVLLIGTHLIWPLPFLSPMQDRITRQTAKDQLAGQLAEALPTYGRPVPVFVTTYQWTALLRFHGIDARQIDAISRPSHFTQVPDHPTDHDRAYVFSEGFLPPEYVVGFGIPRIVAKYPLVVRGQEVTIFWLIEYSKGAAE